MNTTITANQSLFDLIESMNNTARVPALRSIVHSSMAKCIGMIRQHIREQARNTRNEDELQIDLDQRNTEDELARAENEIKRAMGFTVETTPLEQASLLHAVYDWADSELRTCITSKWDAPLTIEQMLEFMIRHAPKLDPVLAQALAEVARTNVETIAKMHEIQALRERELLTEAAPEILATFKGFGENGHPNAFEELPKVVQHQIGVKVVEAINKARDQVLARILRTRRLRDLADIPILEDAAKQISKWVEQFETRHKDEIHEAIESGRNIRTLEDVTTL